MTEFKSGIYNTVKSFMSYSLGRTIIYTIGHIIIAMTSNNLITGAEWSLAAADAIIEPCINGVWYYILDKYFSTKIYKSDPIKNDDTIKEIKEFLKNIPKTPK